MSNPEALRVGGDGQNSASHLLEGIPVSELCGKYGIGPSMFYRWQKEFFEN
jgi:transposase-like protein